MIAFALWSFVINVAAHAADARKDAVTAANLPRILVLATGGQSQVRQTPVQPVRTSPAR
jgi:hypothetical protein